MESKQVQRRPQNPPSRHHFIPEFLLKQWASPSGELLRYRRDERGKVRRKPASPKSVCFGWDLYETTGFPPEHAQQMETLFMGPLDDRAAKAHALLVDGRLNDLSDEALCDWARFVMSIWFRTPSDVEALHEAVISLTDREVSKRELGVEPPAELPPVALKQLQMSVIRNAIDDEQRGSTLINMHWAVVKISPPWEFFISDWPFDMSIVHPLSGHRSAYLTMPLSPCHLFVASRSRGMARQMALLPQRELAARQNRAAVGHAELFVGASQARGANFIERQFGQEGRPSLVRPIAEKYRGPVQEP